MSQHGVAVGISTEHEDLGRKAYEPPVLEILDLESTENATGTGSDGGGRPATGTAS